MYYEVYNEMELILSDFVKIVFEWIDVRIS